MIRFLPQKKRLSLQFTLGYMQKSVCFIQSMSFPGGASGQESACQCTRQNTRDTASIPGLGKSSRVGNGNPRQYSCLVNSLGRGARQATVHGATKSWTQLSTTQHHHRLIHALTQNVNLVFKLYIYFFSFYKIKNILLLQR